MPEGTTGTEPTSVVNTDGSFTESWYEKYGEENEAHLSRYKNFDDFVDSHISQRKKFSKDPNTLVEIPTEHSSDEVRTAFYKAAGKPEAPEGYEYKPSDELSVKVGVNEEKIVAFKKFAHEKLHLNQGQFAEVLNFYFTDIADGIDRYDVVFAEQQKEEKEKGTVELKKKWGNGYDERVLRSNAVLRKYSGEEAVTAFNAQNSSLMAEFLDNIAEAMSEDTLKGLGSVTSLTKANVKTQIAEIRSQMDAIMKENPSNYKGNSKFKDLQARKTELYKQSSS